MVRDGGGGKENTLLVKLREVDGILAESGRMLGSYCAATQPETGRFW